MLSPLDAAPLHATPATQLLLHTVFFRLPLLHADLSTRPDCLRLYRLRLQREYTRAFFFFRRYAALFS